MPRRAISTLVVAVLLSAPSITAGRERAHSAQAAGLNVVNRFVSAKGWVKPGDTFPLTVQVLNAGSDAADGGTVTIPPVSGMKFKSIEGGEGASVQGGKVVWRVGPVPRSDGPTLPGIKQIVVEAQASTLDEDRQVAWRNISTTASGSSVGSSTSHGPKVIPPGEGFETARYGDRPFPVIPVDYFDRKHAAGSAAEKLSQKINDPANPGSTFNLYQEMSYGQLFPHGDVPSAGIATRGWEYGPSFSFSQNTIKADTCTGATTADLGQQAVEAASAERIHDGWYQLPGSSNYYGQDSSGSALIGAEAGVGALQAIDSGCGPTGKSVYDAAQIADPEIDYDQFDTDKDGVVDFFMMIFPGLGGNGESQLSGVPPYDNIWPHSGSLEDQYVDADTGIAGYVSDDQSKDRLGRPLWYTDTSFTKRTTEDKGDALKAFARVGPYNVNPESAITKASVISHEYGHSLGLPDFYSTGSRATYGTWNLMAEDHSQHMDVFGRQELGWLVPKLLEKGHTEVKDFKDSTVDTHKIEWKDPDGKPYTLTGETVHNGQAYMAKLPPRQVIKPDKVPSGTHVWWSRAGNGYGCPPVQGHNLDIALPGLKQVPAGTPVTLSFKSAWQIEWDYDYGFVLTSTDGGKSYGSAASAKGYSNAASQNPNSVPCQTKYGNGITGSSASYSSSVPAIDRLTGSYGEHPTFIDDQYDLSSLAGKDAVLRFTYSTDPGAAKAGWFIDDLKVTAGSTVIYSSDFETANDTAIFNGGCREDLQTATVCTAGWQYASSVDGSPADHAYYMELRDRAGFDADGHDEDDRASGPSYEPGLSLVYTDENHGYGNVGTDDPPAQSPLDSKPDDMTADSASPKLDDAAFKPGDARDTFSDAPPGRADNYSDPSRPDAKWLFDFNCLSFKVDRMAGDDVGPETTPGDLNADVSFDLGAGCGPFDFGFGGIKLKGGPPGATPGAKQIACSANSKLARASARPRGRGIRFKATGKGSLRLEVFRQSTLRRVTSPRRVFSAQSSGSRRVSWSGRGRGVTDGYYFARLRAGGQTLRVALRRLHGRFKVRPDFYRRSACGFVSSFKLTTPAFGGRSKRALGISYRLSKAADVTVSVLRGKKVIKSFGSVGAKARRTQRLRLSARKLRKGDYKVALHAKSGDRTVDAVLVSRKL